MNFIKSNPFVSALAGITLVLCGILYFLAGKGAEKYQASKDAFEASAAAVAHAEASPLYPTIPNRDGKRKAIVDYRDSITELRGLFDKYRPESVENIKPQALTDRILEANKEVTAAFGTDTTLPTGFFLGFENYQAQLAKEEATGVLNYQLGGIKHAMLGLAAARPSEVIRIHRPQLAEEAGGAFERKPNEVARNFPVEITFKGSESSARKFISFLGETNPYYYVVRSMKIVNEKDAPPKVSDAKFEKDEPAPTPAQDSPFGAFFPDADAPPAPAEGGADPAAPAAPVAPPKPVEEAADSSRILAQVLGSEEVIVFVRFDTLMFLPSAELPKP